MKMGIAFRFGLLLALTGILASGLTGYYAYAASRGLLIKATEERLLTATRVLSSQLMIGIDNTARDARLLSGHPGVISALRGTPGHSRQAAEDDIAALFAEMLKTHPEYFQVRLIDTADYGIERVRIDRDLSGLLRIKGDDLQEKGHLPYVFESLQLSPGTTYVSSPVINHETGAHAGENRPSLHLTAPVYGPGRTQLGLIVINVDLDNIFKQLTADLPPNLGLYLTNHHGDFLLHPDSSQAFAFDQGRRALVQHQFPATAALADGLDQEVVTKAQLAEQQGGAAVSAFIKQGLSVPQQDIFFILGLSQPLAEVLRESDALGSTILRLVLAFSVVSVLLAALLARALTRPLNQMVNAVDRFAVEHVQMAMPITRRDEIGLLARSFEDMQRQIKSQMNTLQDKQRELDHLASHDILTGLPNRRMFLDRLEHAIARAHRSGQSTAVLFIDLDKFKEINDSLGHAAGDVVLRTAADRMLSAVRKIDTVARIGGDEFVILLDGAGDPAAIAHIADKITDSIAQPVMYGTDSLAIGASIGIARYPQNGSSVTELLARADQAMYVAKCNGRNRHVFAN